MLEDKFFTSKSELFSNIFTQAYQILFLTLTHFMPTISFTPPENIRKAVVFLCFQGVSKETNGMKWVILNMEL